MILTGVRTGLQLQGCRDTQGFDSSSEAKHATNRLAARACGVTVCPGVCVRAERARLCTALPGAAAWTMASPLHARHNVAAVRFPGVCAHASDAMWNCECCMARRSIAPVLQDAPYAIICAARRAAINCIGGLVVEYIVAIDVTRVRFPADALHYHTTRPMCLYDIKTWCTSCTSIT